MKVVETDIEEIASRIEDIVDVFSGKRIVFAGGGGFLGRYFRAVIAQLNRKRLDQPCELVVIDNLITTSADEKIDSDHCLFLERDVGERIKIDGTVDFVINAAGIASPFYYRAYPLETLRAAVDGTRNLLELADAKSAKFVFFSSSEIYGNPDSRNVPTQESYRGSVASMGPRACYDESKRLGETLCFIYHDHYGLATNVIRPFNVYGPGMQETDYRILPNFASNIKAGRTLKVYGSGKQTRTYCYVTDAMNGFFRVVARGVAGEAYNVGGENDATGLKVTQAILQHLNKSEDLIQFVEDRKGHDQRYALDSSKIGTLGWQPQNDFQTAMQRTIDWYVENQDWWRTIKASEDYQNYYQRQYAQR